MANKQENGFHTHLLMIDAYPPGDALIRLGTL